MKQISKTVIVSLSLILNLTSCGVFVDTKEFDKFENRPLTSNSSLEGKGNKAKSDINMGVPDIGWAKIKDLSITETEVSGSYEGNFNVTDGGSVNYTLPVYSPQGRRGIEPHISFSYNSSNKSGGLIGIGFTLNGFSKITRCGKTIAMDGTWDNVNFDDSDFACFGGHRLILVNGKYWEDGSEYRTEKDALLRIHFFKYKDSDKIVSYFQVEHPDGIMVSTYGGATNFSNGFKDSSFINARYNVRKEWPISKIHDHFGNYMIYEYYNIKQFCSDDMCHEGDFITTDYYPYRISYTGNDVVGDEPKRYVEFIYEDKPNLRTFFMSDHKSVSSKRIKTIGTVAPNNFVYRKYNFNYIENSVSHNSYLTKVEECAGDGVCKVPTVFEWSKNQEGGLNFAENEAEPYIGLTGLKHDNYGPVKIEPIYATETIHDFYLVDLNGDGLKDILYASGTGLSKWVQQTVIMGTWYYRINESANGKIQFSKDIETGKDANTRYRDWNKNYGSFNNWQMNKMSKGLYFVNHEVYDFDSDGKEELISVKAHQNNPSISKNSVRIEENYLENERFGIKTYKINSTAFRTTKKTMISDFNGDGKMDLIVLSANVPNLSDKTRSVNLLIASYDNGLFKKNKNFDLNLPEAVSLNSFKFIDIDNNRTVDVVGSNFRIDLTGEGSSLTYSIKQTNSKLNFNPENNGRFTDLNGDSLFDFIYFSKDGKEMFCDINTGNVFSHSQKACGTFYEMTSLDDNVSGLFPDKDFLFYDVTGNGKTDIIQIAVDSYSRRKWETGGMTKERHAEDKLERRFYLYENVSKSDLVSKKLYDFFKKNGSYMKVYELYMSLLYDGINRNFSNKFGFRLNISKYFGDINGDSIPDIIVPQHSTYDDSKSKLKIFINNSTGVEKIEKIWEGLGSKRCMELSENDYAWCNTVSWLKPKYSIEYEKGTSKAVYGNAYYDGLNPSSPPPQYPAKRIYPSRDLVERYSVYNISSNKLKSVSREYFDLRYDTLNKRSLGFGTVVTKDEETGKRKIVHLDNHTYNKNMKRFPFNGRVIISRIVTPMGNGRYHAVESKNKPVVKQKGNIYYVVTEWSQSEEFEYKLVDITPKKTITVNKVRSNYNHDTYGRTWYSETHFFDRSQVQTYTTYKTDETNWCMSAPYFITTVKSKDNEKITTRTKYTYNSSSVLESITKEPSETNLYLKTQFNVDDYGNVTEAIISGSNGKLRGRKFEYDSQDHIFLEKVSDLNGKIYISEKAHPSLGLPVTSTDVNGLKTRYVYDRFGKVKKIIKPSGRLIEISYGYGSRSTYDFYKLTSQSKVNGKRTSYSEKWIGPYGNYHFIRNGSFSKSEERFRSQHISYDEYGKVHKVFTPQFDDQAEYKIPSHFVEYKYDSFGRITEIKNPDGNVVNYLYKNKEGGKIVVRTDENGIEKIKEIDCNGNVIKSTEGLDPNGKSHEELMGTAVEYIYGVTGNVEKIISPSFEMTFKYDKLGRQKETDDPARGQTFYFYNSFSELEREENELGEEIKYDYDSFGRLIEAQDKNGTTKWNYGENGMPSSLITSSISAWGHKESIENDSLYRTKSHTVEVSGVGKYKISYDYDKSGNLEFVTYPENYYHQNLKIKMVYDNFGNIEKIIDAKRNKIIWEKIDEDALGNSSEFKLGNGFIFKNRFNLDSGRISKSEVFKGRNLIKDYSYNWDGLGNLSSVLNYIKGTAKSYSYDNMNRLLRVYSGSRNDGEGLFVFGRFPVEEFKYDMAGNLVFRYDIGKLHYDTTNTHATIKAGNLKYSYDAVGNMKKRGDEKIKYTSFNLPETIISKIQSVKYSYDSSNQRVTKKNGNELTVYVGGILEEKYHENGNVTSKYNIYVEGKIVAQYEINQTEETLRRYFVHNHIGTPEIITDEKGNFLSEQQFDSFGKRKNRFYNSIGFTGHEHDNEIGLINMKGRMFDPETGRFLSPDPVIQNPLSSQNYNSYSYVYNNPLKYTDPSGFQADYSCPNGNICFDDDIVEVVPQVTDTEEPPSDAAIKSVIPSGGDVFTGDPDPDLPESNFLDGFDKMYSRDNVQALHHQVGHSKRKILHPWNGPPNNYSVLSFTSDVLPLLGWTGGMSVLRTDDGQLGLYRFGPPPHWIINAVGTPSLSIGLMGGRGRGLKSLFGYEKDFYSINLNGSIGLIGVGGEIQTNKDPTGPNPFGEEAVVERAIGITVGPSLSPVNVSGSKTWYELIGSYGIHQHVISSDDVFTERINSFVKYRIVPKRRSKRNWFGN